MVKIRITSEQYNRLLLREQETRLKSTAMALNEGFKEVMFGVAVLMGMRLTGLNKTMGDSAIKTPETLSQIKSTLEDASKIKDLSKALGEKGLPNPDRSLAKNALKIVNTFNELSSEIKMDGKVTANLLNLDSDIAKEHNLV